MFVSKAKRKSGAVAVRLVISKREKGAKHSKTIIVKTIGQSKEPEHIDRLEAEAKKLARLFNEGLISFPTIKETPVANLFEYLGHRVYHRGFVDIFGTTYDNLGFSDLHTSDRNPLRLNQIMKYTVLTRIFEPASKLESQKLFEKIFYKEISYKQIFGMLDHISDNEDSLKTKLFKHLMKGRQYLDSLLFDVTTLHFESVTADDLRDFGYSKDGKFNEVQVVLAVLSDHQGMPFSYEIFPGNTGEIKTFIHVVDSFVRKHSVKKLRVVADRGMFSDANLKLFEKLAQDLKVEAEFVVSCPLRKLPKKISEEILDFKHKIKCQREGKEDEEDTSSSLFYECEHKGRRIIVSYSEKRRKRDEEKRQKTLDKLHNKANKKGLIPPSALEKKTGLKRYVSKENPREAENRSSMKVDYELVRADAIWDGLYGVCTNKDSQAKDVLGYYRNLWRIEELFRTHKHTLEMKPIYHQKSSRIRAHIFVCFLAYCVLKHTELTLKDSGHSFNPQRLIDILSEAGIFVLNHKNKGLSEAFCMPVELSSEAKEIYSIFDLKYPIRPYKSDMRIKKVA